MIQQMEADPSSLSHSLNIVLGKAHLVILVVCVYVARCVYLPPPSQTNNLRVE